MSDTLWSRLRQRVVQHLKKRRDGRSVWNVVTSRLLLSVALGCLLFLAYYSIVYQYPESAAGFWWAVKYGWGFLLAWSGFPIVTEMLARIVAATDVSPLPDGRYEVSTGISKSVVVVLLLVAAVGGAATIGGGTTHDACQSPPDNTDPSFEAAYELDNGEHIYVAETLTDVWVYQDDGSFSDGWTKLAGQSWYGGDGISMTAVGWTHGEHVERYSIDGNDHSLVIRGDLREDGINQSSDPAFRGTHVADCS